MKTVNMPCLSPLFLLPLALYFLLGSVGLGLGQLNRMGAGFFPFALAIFALCLLFFLLLHSRKGVRSKSHDRTTGANIIPVIGCVTVSFVLFALAAHYFNPFIATATTLLFVTLTLQRISLKARILFVSGLYAPLYFLIRTLII